MSEQVCSAQLVPAPSGVTETQAWLGESHGTRDIAKEAYDEAIQHLKDEFSGRAKEIAWLDTIVTMEDVQSTVSDIQQHYNEDVKYSKAKNCLQKFSTVVLHYGTVLDVLSQQHPEYVSLVWGSLKFLLIGVVGHAKLMAEYAEALVCIGDLLPRARLNAELYRNEFMRGAVSRLYAQILRFFRPAIAWYSASSFGRAVKAVFNPFESGLRDTVEKIKTCAELMDTIADSSMRADQRTCNVDVKARLFRLEALCYGNKEALGSLTKVVRDVYSDTKTLINLADGIRGDTEDSRQRLVDIQPRIRGIEFREEFKTLEPRVLPLQALTRQRSVSRAQQPWTLHNQDMVTLIRAIGDWIESPTSSLLILDAAYSKQIAAELIGSVLHPKAGAVCWSLSAASSKGEAATVAGILGSLAWQLYKLDPVRAARCLDGNIDHTSETQTAHLLSLMLLEFRDCYIIIEAEDIAKSMKENAQLSRLSSGLQMAVEQTSRKGGTVKILLAGCGRATQPTSSPAKGASAHSTKAISLRPAVTIPVSRQHHGNRSLFQSAGWLGLRAKVSKRQQ